jgi:cell wall-associated NlpC family hydrolase
MRATSQRPGEPGRQRRRLRHLAVGLSVAAIVSTSLAIGLASPAGARAPTEIEGDHHSLKVRSLAITALEALSSYDHSKTAADRAAYEQALETTAAATAAEFGVSPLQMRAAWASVDGAHQTALLSALSQLGVAYRSATSEPGVGFDCSGLMFYAWGEAGYTLTRQSGSQISEADAREMDTAVAGDIAQYPGHVMMYLGVPRTFVHASNPENDVELWMTSEDRAAGLRYGDPTE